MVKITYSDDLPQITAPANDGQDLQVPSRPLSRGYTVFYIVFDDELIMFLHHKMARLVFIIVKYIELS